MKRFLSLDALRGFAILTMVLSGVIPYGELPAWMYHAQIPPPGHKFNPDLPGLTWVDLVFPLFIFALGCAIPFALSKRREKGANYFELIKYVSERAFLLAFFAIFLQHVRPHQILNPPGTQAWLLALLGFLLLFAIFVRLPQDLPPKVKGSIRMGGWLFAITLLFFMNYPGDKGFSLYRSDIIILVLANVYFFTALIWLLSQKKMIFRLAILLLYLALRLSHEYADWTQALWNISPLPWLFKVDYLKYLFIAIPGTIIGDMLLEFSKQKGFDLNNPGRENRYLNVSIFMILLVVTNLVGLQGRWVAETFIINVILGLILFMFFKKANPFDLLIRNIYLVAFFLLVFGFLLEPFEGGIKKDPSTLSYYAITTSLSLYILIFFILVIDYFNKKEFVKVLISNGQNPMIAYVGIANLIWPITHLTGLQTLIENITSTPWLGFLRGLLFTFLLALMVHWFTKRKLIWRA